MIIKENRTEFVPAPEGTWRAVCVDIVDLGEIETRYGKKPKVKIVFEIEAGRDDGRRHLVKQTFTASLHENASLRGFLNKWRKVPFTPQDLEGFEMDTLLGIGAKFVVEHSTSQDGRIWANVGSFLPIKREEWLQPSGKYQREKDRPVREGMKSISHPDASPDDDTGGPTPF